MACVVMDGSSQGQFRCLAQGGVLEKHTIDTLSPSPPSERLQLNVFR